MATIKWIGGSGTWDSSTTTHWDTGSVPTAADDVVFDASSGGGTCTLSGTRVCRSVTGSASVTTLSWGDLAANKLQVGDASGGAFTFASGKISNISASTDGLQLVSTSSNGGVGWPITSSGNTMPTLTCNGVGGRWQFQDAWTGTINGTGLITITNGTLDTNGKTVNTWGVSSNNSNTRGIILGASAITCTSTSATAWVLASTGLTFDAGTSLITLSGVAVSAIFAGGGLTYYDVIFTGGGTLSGMTGANTFHNLSITSPANNSSTFTIASSITVQNTPLFTGNSVSPNRLLVSVANSVTGVTGVPITITVNGSHGAHANVDFQDITIAGTAGALTGTSIGDCLGNTNITFTVNTGTSNGGNGVNRYLVAGGASVNFSASNWSTSDGGATGASVPLPQDDVYLTSNAFSGTRTLTLDQARLCRNFDATGLVSTTSINRGTGVVNQVFGNFKIPSITNFNTVGGTFCVLGRGSQTFTSGGTTIVGGLAINAPGGTYTVQDNTTIGRTTTLFQGTWDEGSSHTVIYQWQFLHSLVATSNWVHSNGGTTQIGDPTIALTAILAVLNISGAGFTVTTTGSSLVFARNSDAFQKQATFGGYAWNNVTINANCAGGLGFDMLNATSNPTFVSLTIKAPNKLRLSSSFTPIVTTFTWDNAGSYRLESTTTSGGTGVRSTFSVASGTVTIKYATIQDMAFTGGAKFLAQASSDLGNNTGIVFSREPISVARTAATARTTATARSNALTTGVSLPGSATNLVTTPDSANLRVLGDITIDGFIQPRYWFPNTTHGILTKNESVNQRSYMFYINNATGTLVLLTSPDGTSANQLIHASTATLSSVAGIINGVPKWVRASMDVDDGAGNRVVKFYTSNDGFTWTQLGATVTTAGVTSIFNSTSRGVIGSNDISVGLFVGNIYAVKLYNSYLQATSGSPVFSVDFRGLSSEVTSFTASTGEAITINQSGTSPARLVTRVGGIYS